MRRTVLFLLGLGACRSPSSPPPTPDPLAGLAERYDANPAAVIAEIQAGSSDPVAQEAAVVYLCEARPGQTARLCAALSEGSAARRRCERFNSRPHLWSIGSSGASSSGRLGLPEAARRRWVDTAPDLAGCAVATDHACLEAQATARARAGDVAGVAAVCMAFAEERLREDCFFARSEELPYGLGLYGQAVSLCGGSGRYAHECHGHLLLRMRADDPEPLRYERLLAEAAQVRERWEAQDAAFGAQAEDLYWATAASRTLGTVRPFPADAFVGLPEAVHPHVRSAIALRVLNEVDPLGAAQAAARGERPELARAMMPPAISELHLWRGALQYGSEGGGGKALTHRIAFNDVRGGTRPVHPDPEVDLILAVMTAVAMRNPPRQEVLSALAQDGAQEAVVRWGAQRLLQEVSGRR